MAKKYLKMRDSGLCDKAREVYLKNDTFSLGVIGLK